MTTSPVASISDDELASISEYVKRQDKADNSPVCIDFRELRGLVSRLQEAEKDAARFEYIERDADSGMSRIYGENWVDVIDANIAMEQQL